MKKHLLWTFDRGSFQWDIMCLLILVFLFAIPRDTFHDVPEFMKVPDLGSVRKTSDQNGMIYTVRMEPVFFDSDATRQDATRMLEHSLSVPVRPSRIQPIRDWTGRLIGYAIWKEEAGK